VKIKKGMDLLFPPLRAEGKGRRQQKGRGDREKERYPSSIAERGGGKKKKKKKIQKRKKKGKRRSRWPLPPRSFNCLSRKKRKKKLQGKRGGEGILSSCVAGKRGGKEGVKKPGSSTSHLKERSERREHGPRF